MCVKKKLQIPTKNFDTRENSAEFEAERGGAIPKSFFSRNS
jgi:hypothetical protein